MTAALIIATGRTENKDDFEPMRETGTIPALQRVAMVFRQSGIERIVVVCGEKQERAASNMGLIFLRAGGPSDMLENVKRGLIHLEGKCSAVLITHVDVPLFSLKTVQTLLAADGSVRVPCYQGKPGHPIYLSADHFPEVLSYQGKNGLAGAIRSAGLERSLVEVGDKGVLADIQGQEDYEQLVETHDMARLHFDVRLRLIKERAFFDPGAQQLLEMTRETGSLLDACRQMGISYSKGRKVVALIEQQLGFRVIESRQGGRDGGRSELTGEGERLLERFASFQSEASSRLEELFAKYFPEP